MTRTAVSALLLVVFVAAGCEDSRGKVTYAVPDPNQPKLDVGLENTPRAPAAKEEPPKESKSSN